MISAVTVKLKKGAPVKQTNELYWLYLAFARASNCHFATDQSDPGTCTLRTLRGSTQSSCKKQQELPSATTTIPKASQ